MSNKEGDIEKKRKRGDKSSLSELEHSINSPDPDQKKVQKKKKRAGKTSEKEEVNRNDNKGESERERPGKTENMEGIQTELKRINEKLSNVITKDDPSFKRLIKEVFKEMKDELLKSVTHRIDTLESRLFTTEKEADSLKERIKTLENQMNDQKTEENRLMKEMEKQDTLVKGILNEQEQYSRRNSLRISGIKEEDNEITTNTVIETINKIKEVNIQKSDIDIAHRVGKQTNGKRQIIVKFISRTKIEAIMKNKKSLKGTGVFINEDLTRLNLLALSSLRKKLPDEVETAWTRNGRIKYRNRMGNVHTLEFSEYQTWVDLPWPAPEEQAPDAGCF